MTTPDETDGGTVTSEAANFEAGLERLEAVVDRLEAGELSLEESLSSFEEGVRLTRSCAEQLEAAERRIEVLTREGDEWVARVFDDEPHAAGATETEA
ncbi:MAG: exodeoxyribonuclease VII small subunit [Myxococcota bacterium]|nr:exodeoxyribonuclease VII small subunit [Myxococcota bacterium]